MTEAATHAQRIIDRCRAEQGLEGDDGTILFHVLVDLIELCDARSIDFDAKLQQARDFLIAESARDDAIESRGG